MSACAAAREKEAGLSSQAHFTDETGIPSSETTLEEDKNEGESSATKTRGEGRKKSGGVPGESRMAEGERWKREAAVRAVPEVFRKSLFPQSPLATFRFFSPEKERERERPPEEKRRKSAPKSAGDTQTYTGKERR